MASLTGLNKECGNYFAVNNAVARRLLNDEYKGAEGVLYWHHSPSSYEGSPIQTKSMEGTVTSVENNQLIADVTRDIVSLTEPGELPLFLAISTEYFKRPAGALKNQSGRDELLGFGIGETVPLLTPAVLVVMTQVVTFLTVVVKQSVAEESASFINEQVKRMFKKFRQEGARDELAPAPLTLEQLAQVRKQAYEKFLQLRFSEARANCLADAVIASLIVAPPAQEEK
jgi:hypothetical protein